ncbi:MULTISPECIES: hypothetical protein [unclassified Pseudomonas]|uniref:hypothetical protein n=1 Tax=unclassified Pseudomonas TaxID=196821 RepID=UPI00128D411E|nr:MULTISPECIES: hypothetical protein [unclassified Pseudomonas]MPQ67390.1 hypothetical protein [Pseudomonas sp. MWU12-2323]
MNASRIEASIRDNSRNLEAQLRQLQLELSAAHDQELRLQQGLGNAFPHIANYQLSGGAPLSVEVQRLLDQREQAEAALRQELAQVEEGIAGQLQVISGLAEALETQVADLDQQVEQDLRDQQQAALISEADEQSYKELRDECRLKLQAFQADPLYVYLRDRGFGTEGYVGRFVWRGLDRWVARLCNFTQNSAAERTLLAMQRANEAVGKERQANRAAQEAERARLHQRALSASDLPVLQERQRQAQQALEAGKAQANALHQRLAPYVSKRDEGFAKASELLSRQLAEMNDLTLEHLAGQTQGAQDDELVRRVRDLRAELEVLRLRVPSLERQCRDAEASYELAKQLERTLQSGGLISSRYDYQNVDLDGLLVGFMRGALSLSQVVSEVDNNREFIRVAPSPSSSARSSSSRSRGSHSSSGSFFGGGSSGGSSSASSSGSSSSGSGGGFSTSDSL